MFDPRVKDFALKVPSCSFRLGDIFTFRVNTITSEVSNCPGQLLRLRPLKLDVAPQGMALCDVGHGISVYRKVTKELMWMSDGPPPFEVDDIIIRQISHDCQPMQVVFMEVHELPFPIEISIDVGEHKKITHQGNVVYQEFFGDWSGLPCISTVNGRRIYRP